VALSEKCYRWGRLRAGLDLVPDQQGADMADLPGGASGLLARHCKGKEADTLVDPSVVWLVAGLRGHERQAAEERKPLDASLLAIKPAARHGEPAKYSPPVPRPPTGDRS
jgi:hypothetical protein